MYVYDELSQQSHMQLYTVRDQDDSQRKEFEKIKKEKSSLEKRCEQLQKKLKTV